ncbi:MAG: hypothetical protein JWO36_5038 [Myxococcales bacterium]|nr:hypothetical protein [Myxococcales bacterium]
MIGTARTTVGQTGHRPRILVLVALAACSRSSPDAVDNRQIAPKAHGTNVARADYLGPKACGDCHADEYARWQQSLHRVMNAKAEDAQAVIGDFSGAIVSYAGGEARFSREGGAYLMELRKGERRVRYRVTRTIGRRGLQEYVGVEDGRTEEVRLPFGWWPRRDGWYPQPYFDPWLGDEAGFDAYAPVREPWAERCPWCHSTYPFALRIERAMTTQLGHGLEQWFAEPDVERAGSAAPYEPDRRGPGPILDVTQQVTTGISCESCHLGGRDHAAGAPIHLVPQGLPTTAVKLPARFSDERRDSAIVNTVCAQCHSGPSPRLADGTALRNSSEALDLAASPCTGIKCTDCHDPHRADARGDDARAIAACTRCHAALAEPKAALAHAGSGHATTTCLDCHMPRVVMGIDRYVRTHRISSPTNPKLLAAAAPNACSLCHLDRSIRWTIDALRDQWDVRARIAEDAYGDRNVGEVWLASPTPAIRLIAAHAYARSPLGKSALPELVRGLADPIAYVRTWTQFAVEDALGRRLSIGEYDARASSDIRAKALARIKWR